MSKYIDVKKVQCLILETGNKHSRNGEDIQTCGSICADLIIGVYELLTDDVAEVRHGKWINDNHRIKCSICGSPIPIRKVVLRGELVWEDNSPVNYCPNCGATMIDEDECNNQ